MSSAFAPDTPQYARILASELLKARKARSLTQTELARRAGLRVATVCRAEKEPHRMRADALQKIAEALGLTLSIAPAAPGALLPANPRVRSL